ncbi:phage prohead protease, HK97 family [Arachidicoccus rhizosphaerae]|uniref:Phage prohead protease, HK97 family n=1 Tax=Arachidicoccus rhizosphaerae TaxID=551991 RepID=A0A1H4CEX7_9BACT|nr:HK97 family phage prohead protease [Arachidicoccus rhizosphaerae]SEA58985.1 phage prohead protease, HK97 family [Arachidicoccus rhizosphaerae]
MSQLIQTQLNKLEEKRKSIKSAPVDMDDKGNRVVVYYAHFGNVDRVKDIMTLGAATEDLKARGPKGEDVIWHTDNHNYDRPVTKPTELIEDEKGLRGVLTIWPNTVVGRDVYELYKSGLITHHSLGYYELENAERNGANEILKIYITHVSNVMDPANFLARTQEVSLKGMDIEEGTELNARLKQFIRDTIASDETIIKAMEAQKNIEKALEREKSVKSLASLIRNTNLKL